MDDAGKPLFKMHSRKEARRQKKYPWITSYPFFQKKTANSSFYTFCDRDRPYSDNAQHRFTKSLHEIVLSATPAPKRTVLASISDYGEF